MDIENAVRESRYNHTAIASDTVCGCYFCLTVFTGGAIEEWADEGTTALCPRCGVDAVLPGVNDTDILAATHERWFCVANDKIEGSPLVGDPSRMKG